jgi:NRPS condensation-like uncharacterized protein
MIADHAVTTYERRITPPERLLTRSPFSIVTMVARIKGHISEDLLRNAVSKVQQRHALLRVRVREDRDHVSWFTSEGVGEIPIQVVAREAEDDWIEVHAEASKVPFEFDACPAIRFILVQSPDVSELIILCHHIICDGMSLAYLARDLMVHLGDPAREVEVLPDPVPIDLDNLPNDVSLSGIARFFINRINKKWGEGRVFFDQEDYRALTKAYWQNFHHGFLSVELSEAQTAALVERCRNENVTVNSALATAFAGAQILVRGEQAYHSRIAVAANLRDRLLSPAGEAMGFYASAVTLKYNYDRKRGFWENARSFHRKVRLLFGNKDVVKEFVTWLHLDPALLEALNFKKLGRLVSPDSPRYEKLSAFGEKDDVVLSILKREKMESLDTISLGTAVTNLGRLDFPTTYGPLELDRLIMQPGGAFPLATVNLVLGAVTCAGKLSLVLEYAEEAVDTRTMEAVKDQALEFLLKEQT